MSVDYAYDGDKLLSYGSELYEYDVLGNPTMYRGKSVTWTNGRQMTAYDGNTFTYDGRGRRTSKNGITFTYDSADNLLKQSNGLEFFYDHSGVAGVKYGGNTYFYRKDILGNVIALLDSNGIVVVKYIYDTWGNHEIKILDGTPESAHSQHIGKLNPFRYRGYYYDTETKLYYLKTRYYDPATCRFVTIDDLSYLDPEHINGLNLYAYCANNPVMNVDPNGTFGIIAGILIGVLIGAAVVGTGFAIYAGVTAYNNGTRGWDLFGTIAKGFFVGAVIGGIIGGAIAAFIYAAPAIGSFLGSSFTIGSHITAAGELAAITITGAQIAEAGLATLAAMGILFAQLPYNNGPSNGSLSNESHKEIIKRNQKIIWRVIY